MAEPTIAEQTTEDVEEVSTVTVMADGDGWRVLDVVCRAGPRDRPYEEEHRWMSISAVMEGSFTYRSERGLVAMTPTSVLLGNAGACFRCGHEHGRGDRCLSFQFDPAAFEEIVAATPGVRKARFDQHRLPPLETMAPAFAALRRFYGPMDEQEREDIAWRFAGRVLSSLSDAEALTPQPADIGRMLKVVDYVGEHLGDPLTLDHLATLVGLSRYHFLRLFAAVVGTTPYRYILARRMARAGHLLATTDLRVLEVALECGFSDLSEFTRRFRARFSLPPAAYRRNACGRSPAAGRTSVC